MLSAVHTDGPQRLSRYLQFRLSRLQCIEIEAHRVRAHAGQDSDTHTDPPEQGSVGLHLQHGA